MIRCVRYVRCPGAGDGVQGDPLADRHGHRRELRPGTPLLLQGYITHKKQPPPPPKTNTGPQAYSYFTILGGRCFS